ncbi:hypothetical protein LDENG_00117630 [Lucifuga dentata]|nr:hypothetical protein LDENG_00117630 [Lucifuga dentata]
MSKIKLLRAHVTQRLSAAAEEIFEIITKKLAENEDTQSVFVVENGEKNTKKLETLSCTEAIAENHLRRVLVDKLLTAAAEEILLHVEEIITEYEDKVNGSKQEIERQHKLLNIFLKPEVRLYRADTPQCTVSVCEEVAFFEPQQSLSLEQRDADSDSIPQEGLMTLDDHCQPLSPDLASSQSEGRGSMNVGQWSDT